MYARGRFDVSYQSQFQSESALTDLGSDIVFGHEVQSRAGQRALAFVHAAIARPSIAMTRREPLRRDFQKLELLGDRVINYVSMKATLASAEVNGDKKRRHSRDWVRAINMRRSNAHLDRLMRMHGFDGMFGEGVVLSEEFWMEAYNKRYYDNMAEALVGVVATDLGIELTDDATQIDLRGVDKDTKVKLFEAVNTLMYLNKPKVYADGFVRKTATLGNMRMEELVDFDPKRALFRELPDNFKRYDLKLGDDEKHGQLEQSIRETYAALMLVKEFAAPEKLETCLEQPTMGAQRHMARNTVRAMWAEGELDAFFGELDVEEREGLRVLVEGRKPARPEVQVLRKAKPLVEMAGR